MNNNSEDDLFDPTEDEPTKLDISDDKRELIWKHWEPSVSELFTRKTDGELKLQPKWQRRYVWDIKKASKLIESILINVPIPIIYLNEENDGDYTVIDGQQRLTALINFIEGKTINTTGNEIDFKLKHLEVLTELNGKGFQDLEKVLQKKIKNTPLRCIIILSKSHPDIKFEIFERLNTGAVKLNDDELRNSIYRGAFIDLLDELSENKIFKKLLNREPFHIRMIDRGMILRFLTFYDKTYLKYKPPVKQFLNNELDEYRNLNKEKEEKFRKVFKHSVEMSHLVFGEKAFRRFFPGDQNNPDGKWGVTRINMALFDIVMWGFTNYAKNQIVPNADSIREELIYLMSNNQEFIDAIELRTSDVQEVQLRFDTWKNSLIKIIGFSGDREPRIFSHNLKEDLFKKDPTCSICGQRINTIDGSEVDHIEMYWKGGKTIPENARLTHRYCNRSRKNN